MPHAFIRITTSSVSAFGSGSSAISSTSGPPCFLMRAAFTRSPPAPRSSAPELRGALLDVGLEALRGVLRLEQLLLQLPLERQRLAQGDLSPRDDAALDVADRPARAAGSAEPARVVHDAAPPV